MRDGGVAAKVSRGNAWLKLGRRLLAGRQTGAVAPEADPQGVGLGDDGETRERWGWTIASVQWRPIRQRPRHRVRLLGAPV